MGLDQGPDEQGLNKLQLIAMAKDGIADVNERLK